MKRIFNNSLLTASRVCEIIKNNNIDGLTEIPKFESIDECKKFAFNLIISIGTASVDGFMRTIIYDWKENAETMDSEEVTDIVANFFIQSDKNLVNQIATIITEKKEQKDLAMKSLLETLEKQKSQIELMMDSLLNEMQSQINT